MRKRLLGILVFAALLAAAPPAYGAAASGSGKETVRRFYAEVWNTMNLKAVDELFAESYDRERLKDIVAMFHFAFPNLSLRVVDLVEEKDRVVAYWVAEGVHEGELFGVQPTGKHVRFTGMEIFRLRDGKIAEEWDVWDRYKLMSQLREGDPLACKGSSAQPGAR